MNKQNQKNRVRMDNCEVSIGMPSMAVNLRRRKTTSWVIIFLGLSGLVPLTIEQDCSAARQSSHVSLWGEANGGTLEIVFVMGDGYISAAIETTPNEDAKAVAARLNDAINKSEECILSDISSTVNDSTLAITYSEYKIALRGTENGLGIPAAPENLACVLDKNGKGVELSWTNPDPMEGYDMILVTENGGILFELPGDSMRSLAPMRDRDLAIQNYTLIGRKNGTPSNVVRCSIQICQEFTDLFDDLVYPDGVAPGWKSWNRSQGTASISFVRGPEPGVVYDADYDHKGDQGFQIIRGTGNAASAFEGGIWKKFTGLIPSHEYWIRADPRLRFGDPKGGEWWYSLHAAHNGISGATLTVEQLAGLDPLPDGTQGPSAGRIILMDNTLGAYRNAVQSDLETLPGKMIGNIKLPAGVTSLTVWVKHGGKIESPGVALDYVIVKDRTCLEGEEGNK